MMKLFVSMAFACLVAFIAQLPSDAQNPPGVHPSNPLQETLHGSFTNNSSYPIAYIADNIDPDGVKRPHVYVAAPGETVPSNVDVDALIDAPVGTDGNGNYVPPTVNANTNVHKISGDVHATATDIPNTTSVNVHFSGWVWSDLGTLVPAGQFNGFSSPTLGPESPPTQVGQDIDPDNENPPGQMIAQNQLSGDEQFVSVTAVPELPTPVLGIISAFLSCLMWRIQQMVRRIRGWLVARFTAPGKCVADA